MGPSLRSRIKNGTCSGVPGSTHPKIFKRVPSAGKMMASIVFG
jgi:hypothetical protein